MNGNLHHLARTLGGEACGGNSILCPGPGHSRYDRSLSVSFDPHAPDGFVVNSFAGDEFRTCRDHVRQLMGLGSFEPGNGRERPAYIPPVARSPAAIKMHEFASTAWNEARPIGGTIAQTYLESRGILLPQEALVGHALRFHECCTFKLDSGEKVRLPSMVAAVIGIRSNEFLAVQRTALKPDGSGKAQMRGLPEDGRKMLGSNKGGVVKLSPDEDVSLGLGLGEGLETCLAVMGNLGFRPMWATLTTSIMAKFPVLPGIEFLTIWADADATKKNGRVPGIDAARACGQRWADAGLEGEILLPPMLKPDGTDWNDLVRMRKVT